MRERQRRVDRRGKIEEDRSGQTDSKVKGWRDKRGMRPRIKQWEDSLRQRGRKTYGKTQSR